jgi:triphosphatase
MAQAIHDFELRLECDPADVRRIKRYLSSRARSRQTGTTRISVYFDTPDFTLYGGGFSLHVRRVGRGYLQSVNVSDGTAAAMYDRSRWEQVIGAPQPDLSLAGGTALKSLLSKRLSNSLRPIFETHIRQARYGLATRGLQVDVALEQGFIGTGKHRVPLCELKFDLVRGEPGGIFALAHALGAIAPLRLGVKSNADRGYEVVRAKINAVDTGGRVHLSPVLTAEVAFRVIARRCLRQLIANETAMLAGSAEALHQMRIALRRFRAAISVFSQVVGDRDSGRIKAELRWITGELGPVRDLDVFVAEVLTPLRNQHGTKPGITALCRDFQRRRARAHLEAAAAVTSARFRTLTLNAMGWIEAGPWSKNRDDLARLRRARPITRHATEELGRRRAKFRKMDKTLNELSPAKRHKLRIRVKKLRYAIEFFADLFPREKSAKRCKASLSALKELQGALGALNDVATRESLASSIAMSRPPTARRAGPAAKAFAAGVVFGAQDAHVTQLLMAADRAYARLLEIKPFWR